MRKPLIAPLCLRLVLGVTFLWAGLGKLVTTFDVQGQTAATLANAGVTLPVPTPEPEPVPLVEPPENTPESADPVAPAPETTAPENTEPQTAEPEAAEPTTRPVPLQPTEPAPEPQPAPEPAPETDPATAQQHTDVRVHLASMVQEDPEPAEAEPPALNDGDVNLFTAEDFPEPIAVRGVYRLVLLMHARNARPDVREDGSRGPVIWPDAVTQGNRAVLLAWTAAITEVVFGAFCLLGLLTRLGALNFVGTMLVAMWLTEIGPAVQAGQTVLGFIPAGRPTYAPDAWRNLFWQFSLLMSAVAVIFMGPGKLALDHLFFGRFTPDDDDDDD